MFKYPFSFEGRIPKQEYAFSVMIYVVGLFAVAGCVMVLDTKSQITGLIAIVLWVPLGYFLLAQGAKRCHDIGQSGMWQLVPFYLFWLVLAPGEVGDNKYGHDPRTAV